MKNILYSIIILFLFTGCSDKFTPQFSYIKNQSSYDVLISYVDNNVTVKSQDNYIADSTDVSFNCVKKVALKDINANLEDKYIDIKIINSLEKEGFHDGEYCRIIEFSDNYKKNSFEYEIKNTTSNDIKIECTYLNRKIEFFVSTKETNTFNFEYDKPSFIFICGEYEIQPYAMLENGNEIKILF